MAIKTLHLTNAWHQTSGGVATFYRALMREANRRGHEFRLVVPAEQDRIEQIGNHVKLYHVAAPAAPLNSAYRTIYPTQFLFRGSKIQSILLAERPDLIEISDKYTLAYLGGLLRLRLLRAVDYRPVVIGLSSERMDDNFRSYLGSVPFGKGFCSWYMRWIYFPFFDHHIANSSYTAEELRAASSGHPVRRGTWVHQMGVDLSELSPAHRSDAGRQRLLALCGAARDSVLLLYVGRLAPEKNLSLLFELAGRLNESSSRSFHLIVVGSGIERAKWEQYSIEHLPGQVLFLGHIRDRKMLAALYANADIFVHPNPHEPFGIAPLEAMASGIPLVAPDSGGVTSYAHSGNAWMVPVPATTDDFAAAIADILRDPNLAREKVDQALLAAASYGWDTVATSFLDLYQDLHGAFHGLNIRREPAFYSTPARPGRAKLISWVSQWATKGFTAVAQVRETERKDSPPTLKPESRQQHS
jgi:alpha-1,6-mannosyltransferase